jgi:hypothetical protein
MHKCADCGNECEIVPYDYQPPGGKPEVRLFVPLYYRTEDDRPDGRVTEAFCGSRCSSRWHAARKENRDG